MTELEILTATIKKHTNKDLGDSYNMLGGTTLTQLIVKAMQTNHTAKLEEVGRELKKFNVTYKGNNQFVMFKDAAALLASKDAEISTLKSEISRLKGEALGDGSCGKSWSPQDQR